MDRNFTQSFSKFNKNMSEDLNNDENKSGEENHRGNDYQENDDYKDYENNDDNNYNELEEEDENNYHKNYKDIYYLKNLSSKVNNINNEDNKKLKLNLNQVDNNNTHSENENNNEFNESNNNNDVNLDIRNYLENIYTNKTKLTENHISTESNNKKLNSKSKANNNPVNNIKIEFQNQNQNQYSENAKNIVEFELYKESQNIKKKKEQIELMVRLFLT